MRPATITTDRLVLSPLPADRARAVLAGDYSSLARTEGWPHEDTLDAVRMAAAPESGSLVWLVLSDGTVIGDCGTLGGLDDTRAIEIGYGLAAECRRRGYGNELVAALSSGCCRSGRSTASLRERFSRATSPRVVRWRMPPSSSSAKRTA